MLTHFFRRDACWTALFFPDAVILQAFHSNETCNPFLFSESSLAQWSQPSFLFQTIKPSYFFRKFSYCSLLQQSGTISVESALSAICTMSLVAATASPSETASEADLLHVEIGNVCSAPSILLSHDSCFEVSVLGIFRTNPSKLWRLFI